MKLVDMLFRKALFGGGGSGGGGGGSDGLSAAEVTITIDVDYPHYATLLVPCCIDDGVDSRSYYMVNNSGTYKIPLYKGNCEGEIETNGYEGLTIETTGRITRSMQTIFIMGDGTISISEQAT